MVQFVLISWRYVNCQIDEDLAKINVDDPKYQQEGGASNGHVAGVNERSSVSQLEAITCTNFVVALSIQCTQHCIGFQLSKVLKQAYTFSTKCLD